MTSPFSFHSPGTGPKSSAPLGEPVMGTSRADDPGLLGSLRGGSYLGRLRLTMLVLMVAPVVILAMVPLMVREDGSRLDDLPEWLPLWTLLLLPPVVAALVTVLVVRRSPAPLAVGLAPPEAAGAALTAFRQALFLRFALAETVILLGLPLSVIGRSELPFLVAFALGYPLLLRLSLPTAGTVERIRARLEASGAESHLWPALLATVPRPAR